MKTLIFTALMTVGFFSAINVAFPFSQGIKTEIAAEKLDIKIKNDTGDVVKVINAGSGGSYSLTKGATTTIKMEEGDKLHRYDQGKKGALILTASKDMDGKVQLLSKL